ncbi:hypothetical protein TNCV_2822881 [Trichonephila clavipes]|nr:hypothetical protein TNCV_2822881 [Trichonephila clavipes]
MSISNGALNSESRLSDADGNSVGFPLYKISYHDNMRIPSFDSFNTNQSPYMMGHQRSENSNPRWKPNQSGVRHHNHSEYNFPCLFSVDWITLPSWLSKTANRIIFFC